MYIGRWKNQPAYSSPSARIKYLLIIRTTPFIVVMFLKIGEVPPNCNWANYLKISRHILYIWNELCYVWTNKNLNLIAHRSINQRSIVLKSIRRKVGFLGSWIQFVILKKFRSEDSCGAKNFLSWLYHHQIPIPLSIHA